MKKILFGVFISTFLIACGDKKPAEQTASSATSTTPAETKKPPTEVLDLSEADGVKAGQMAFTKGDIDGMTASFDDNAKPAPS